MITAAVLIILGSLTAFNVKIRQIYLTGSYKNRFNGMDFTATKGLEKLYIKNANIIGVRIEKGNTEGVWLRGNAKDQYQVSYKDHALTLGLSKEGENLGSSIWGEVIIVTKTLSAVQSTSSVIDKDKRYDAGTISMTGLQLDKLSLQISSGVTVSLGQMQIDELKATVGDKTGTEAGLNISSTTQIRSAELNVPGKSSLVLANPKITKATYNLSDSATVTVNGKMVQLIK